MLPAPLLQTPRLRLREFVARDRSALVAMHREPRVRALLVDDQPLDDARVAHLFIERLQALYRTHEGLGLWHAEHLACIDAASARDAQAAVDAGELDAEAVERLLAPSWRFCGWFNLMPMPDASRRVEIGCRLLPQAWGQGLPLEGGAALLRHAFERLALPEVWGVCDPRHRAVKVVLLSLGFSSCGDADYGSQCASYFRIDPRAWALACEAPLRARRRDAAARLRGQGSQKISPPQVDSHCPPPPEGASTLTPWAAS